MVFRYFHRNISKIIEKQYLNTSINLMLVSRNFEVFSNRIHQNSNYEKLKSLNEDTSLKCNLFGFQGMCRLIPKINKRLICYHSLRDMSVFAATFTTVFALIEMGMHYHGMYNPNITQISYYREYHTPICIIVICVFGFLFVSSIIFAIGIQEEWPLLYLPWLVTYSIVTIMLIAQLIYLVIDNFHFPHMILGVLAGVNTFFIWIACNFYEETRDKVRADKRKHRDQRQATRESVNRYSDY